MPYITTVLYYYVSDSGWESETVTISVSPTSSRSFNLTRHATRTSTLSTFANSTSTFATSTSTFANSTSTFATSTSTFTSSSTTEPSSTDSTTSRPTVTGTSSLSSKAQSSKFSTGVGVGVSGAVFILLVALISLLAWKGKLRRLNLLHNPYVTKMKRQAQYERVRKVEEERLEDVRRRERERAIERGWGVGNERESRIMEGDGDLSEMAGLAR